MSRADNDCPAPKRAFTNVYLQISKSGKFKALCEDSAIGTPAWVIYSRVT